jgi:hypothetical protein
MSLKKEVDFAHRAQQFDHQEDPRGREGRHHPNVNLVLELAEAAVQVARNWTDFLFDLSVGH